MKPFSLDPGVQRDLADFLIELVNQKVRFAVVGGWAVMAHTGKPRPTKDLDIYVAPDDVNLLRVAQALGRFGAPAHLCSVGALAPQAQAKFSGVTFGLPPNRIDVLTRMEVEFAELEMRVQEFDMEGRGIPVASPSDLLTLKRLALQDDPRRKTDRADIKALEALQTRS